MLYASACRCILPNPSGLWWRPAQLGSMGLCALSAQPNRRPEPEPHNRGGTCIWEYEHTRGPICKTRAHPSIAFLVRFLVPTTRPPPPAPLRVPPAAHRQPPTRSGAGRYPSDPPRDRGLGRPRTQSDAIPLARASSPTGSCRHGGERPGAAARRRGRAAVVVGPGLARRDPAAEPHAGPPAEPGPPALEPEPRRRGRRGPGAQRRGGGGFAEEGRGGQRRARGRRAARVGAAARRVPPRARHRHLRRGVQSRGEYEIPGIALFFFTKSSGAIRELPFVFTVIVSCGAIFL